MCRGRMLVLWCVVVGYVSAVRFKGPEHKMWEAEQCSDLEGIYGLSSPKECMIQCKNTVGCTALNYDSDESYCALRACALPVPKPRGNKTSAHGYSLVADSGSMCSDRLDSCAKRVADGECENNISYMSNHCMASCIMFATTERTCSDNNSNCETLAARGRCEDEPMYMNFNCPETCNLCASTECEGFLCGDRQCIDSSRKCDGANDCNDNSDEIGCSNDNYDDYYNNNNDDYGDYSDDDYPSNPASFPEPCEGFPCNDGQCINSSHICDGYKACNDNSDIIDCTCPNGSIGASGRPGPTRCFVVFKDTERNWEEARRKCTAEGLSMALSMAASSDESYNDILEKIIEINGNGTSVWLEARGDGFNLVWQHNRIGLRNDNPLWQSDEPAGHITTEDCLYMDVKEYSFGPYAYYSASYASYHCSSRENLYTLCEY